MRCRLLLTLVSLLAIGCTDDARRRAAPTEPAAASAADAAEASLAPSAKSSICAVYQREHTVVLGSLSKSPSDAALVARRDAMATLIKDVCD